MADNGWDRSAEAWITDMAGDSGDWGRQFVLDPVMLRRVRDGNYKTALDVGCGEGRFCRKLRDLGITAIGVDPTTLLLEQARVSDPQGDYRQGISEDLPFAEDSFDLVITCLSLVDIDDYPAAIREMNRVLRPGGTLLVANLTSFTTAKTAGGWHRDTKSGDLLYFKMDRYLEGRGSWERWRGVEIKNYHRPLSAYMRAFLAHGLILNYFDEPAPSGGDPEKVERYSRAPWYLVMEWRKPDR